MFGCFGWEELFRLSLRPQSSLSPTKILAVDRARHASGEQPSQCLHRCFKGEPDLRLRAIVDRKQHVFFVGAIVDATLEEIRGPSSTGGIWKGDAWRVR